MINKVDFESQFEIFLFLKTNKHQSSSSALNEFLSYCKYHNAKRPFKFSHVGQSSELILEISLKENIVIGFSPDSLTESKDIQLQKILDLPNYSSLKALYNQIPFPDEKPSLHHLEVNKLTLLIKALLCKGHFLFFENPEEHLSTENLELFINALKEHIKIQKKNIFISSECQELWMPHCQQVVKRNSHYHFETTSAAKKLVWEKERQIFYKDFNLHNPVDNCPPDSSGQIRFTLPHCPIKKNRVA